MRAEDLLLRSMVYCHIYLGYFQQKYKITPDKIPLENIFVTFRRDEPQPRR